MISRIVLFLLVVSGCQTSLPFHYTGSRLKGVNLVAPPRQPDSSALAPVRSVGGEWVAIVPYGFCRKGDPHFFFSENRKEKRDWQWWGETTEGVAGTIRMARRQGLKTMLKPHVWMQGGSHLDLEFTREADWQTFEHDYAQYVLHFARIADSLDVDLYCITTELDRFAIARPAFWRQLIEQVKQVYKGKLTYAANWDRYERIPFWSQLDYVGVDAYFPLSEAREPSVEDLTKGWEPHLSALEAFSSQLQKPILFTEFGYRACDHAARRPWESETDCTPNPTAQANAYAALTQAVWPKPWFAGGFIWKWFIDNDLRHRERDQYSPQGRMAESILTKQWSNQTR
ncbi:hypothetical protein HNV11_06785 [Spirosoma taeanense]|uniref:GTA TIM-barrel-like domain-containing protein n=1 Tax=Spirosoma taeanense TaxID=2735870 RepID=A0A6M5Y6S9_9BACT|nr:hypothetical protein [Spirosoma taeanense]QJW89116.1 hypothetical protein HNV11_06785 [Spirosoma taeanense]